MLKPAYRSKSFHLQMNECALARLDAKKLQFPLRRKSDLVVKWNHLQDFFLQQSLTPDTLRLGYRFIMHASNLRRLSLRFCFNESEEFAHYLAFSAHTQQRLEGFTLEGANTTSDALLRLLRHFHKSLRVLSFSWFVVLTSGTWGSILRELRTGFPGLKSLSVRFAIPHKSDGSAYVTFPSLADSPLIPGSEDDCIPRSDVAC